MNKVKLLGLLAAALCALAFSQTINESATTEISQLDNHRSVQPNDPPCLQMYHHIEQYADSFNIPKKYAYGIAYAETRYRGPFHWKYNHKQTSSAGAVGPMQIMPSTADYINKEHISTNELRSDIEYNVRTSMKLLRNLYDKYGDWKTVFGCYNTGRPCVNGYAVAVYNFEPTW
jgi:soluble lytic murein transglycosylase-like protein